MKKNQFVAKHGLEWAAKGANNSRATRVVPTQVKAIEIAKTIAKNQHSEMPVQNKNG